MSDVKPVYCDITEILQNPIRTGIQRVAREILRNWDSERPLRLCRFDRTLMGLVEVAHYANYYLLEPDSYTRNHPVSWIQTQIAGLINAHDAELVPLDATILIPEIFFDDLRCRHYLSRIEQYPEQIHILYYDFILWLQPDIIGVQRSHQLMWYIQVAQKVQRAAFISEATRNDWAARILRDPQRTGEILPLGADGLRLGRMTFEPRKRTFVSFGSIDGRKNQLSIIRAFKMLWDEGVPVSLTLVGRVFASETTTGAELRSCSEIPDFKHVDHATDEQVAIILSDARATIYASEAEGFGLPPVESLYAGIPCIVSRNVPSVTNLPGGLRFLEKASPDEIAREVRLLAKDDEAERAWSEAALLKLPTWKDFGTAVARWIG